MITLETEKMSDIFMKYHIRNAPFNGVLHHFSMVPGDNAHNHPWGFTSFILYGGYTERVYDIGLDGIVRTRDIYRSVGTVHSIEANHIHEIIDMPKGECCTIVLPKLEDYPWGFYRFYDNQVWFRQHDKQEWEEYIF